MTIQLIHGDCLDVDWPQVDAIITDVPYGVTACKWDSIIPFEPMWAKIKGSLKPRGAFVTTASQPFTSALVMSNPKWFKYEWIWNKKRAGNFLTAKLMPMISHENILVFSGATVANCAPNNMLYFPQMEKRDKPITYKKGRNSELYARKNTVTIKYTSDKKYPKSIVTFDKERSKHPTSKPVALYEYLIKTYTNKGDTVLDFCAGSGTTLQACINTERNGIGIEKDEKYYNIAKARLGL